MQPKRINSIDILRFFCAFGVVAGHTYLFGIKELYPIYMPTPPIFFMISGFFAYNVVPKKQLKRIKSTLAITLSALIFYYIAYFFIALISHKLPEYIQTNFSLKTLIDLVLFNDPRISVHLWYMLALLFALIIDYFVTKFKVNKKLILCIVIALFLTDLVLGKYSRVIWNGEIDNIHYLRNFLFVGYPYFFLGKLFREVDADKIKLNNVALVSIIVLFSAASVVTRQLLVNFDLFSQREQYLSTTIVAVTAFILALKNPYEVPRNKLGKIASWGKKYSLMIYIIHPFIMRIFSIVIGHMGKTVISIYEFFETFIVFIAALGFSMLYYKLKPMVLQKFQRKG